MSVHIRVVTPVIPTGLTSADDFQGILGPEDTVDFVELDRGPASIESAFDEMLAASDTVAKILEAEAAGADAVVLDCMEDPGLKPGREAVSIPVLGPCETSMNLACVLGHRFSVLAVTSGMAAHFEDRARLYGAWDKYASTQSVQTPVAELRHQSAELRSRLLEQARHAITQHGADTLVLGCTGMLGLAQGLQADLDREGMRVPVIDPMPVTIRLAKALAESRLCHSKRCYPTPKPKRIAGYADSALNRFNETPQ